MRVRGEFATRFARFFLDAREIYDDEHRSEFSRVADDHRVGDQRRRFQQVFDRRRRDKFSARRLQQLFLAIGDDEVAVFIDSADIAGAAASRRA